MSVVLAFVRTYAYLATGSAFMHGSETEAGHVADIRLNDLFAYIGYQAAVAGLEPLDSSILHDLSVKPRSKSAVETTEDLQAIYTDQSVEEWTDALNEMDVPGVRLGMCAYIIACFSFFLDGDELQSIAETIISAIE